MMNLNTKKEIEILYEDNHIIVVCKPANILSQADATNDFDMTGYLKEYLKEKYQKPGNVFVGLVHRLDRRVSGVMVFAKTSKAASRLSKVIRENDSEYSFNKDYVAIVAGKLKKDGYLENYLSKVKTSDGYLAKITNANDKGSKLATLEYKVIKQIKLENIDATILKVKLITGRYNQIRVQLANFGYPIINDFKYGYRNLKISDELALTSYRLSFPHPVKGEIMEFTYYPKSDLWIDLKEDQ